MGTISEIRLKKEAECRTKALSYGLLGKLHWENAEWPAKALELLLKAIGLWRRGVRNILDIRLEEVEVRLSRLPEAFDGTRLLWISDIHVDKIDGQTERILEILAPLTWDYGVFGGDSCFDHHVTEKAAQRTGRIAAVLAAKAPAFAVLGNHDYEPIVPVLNDAGVKVLLNENVLLERDGQKLCILGVDDCHYFKADDLDLAARGVDPGLCKILLCHSPEIFKKAAELGIDLYLCGHTHGGQIRLPGGFAPVTCAKVPKSLVRGLWAFNGMAGYTSGGAGGSGAPVRFNCPPEITLFTLKKGQG